MTAKNSTALVFLPHWIRRHFALFVVVVVLFAHTTSCAAEDAHGDDGHGFHPNEVGVFVGATTPFDEEVGGGTSFTIGVEYERRFTADIGVIALAEFARGDHKRAELFAAEFAWRPIEDLRVGLGPGFELVEKDKPSGGTKRSAFFVVVTRANYELHLDKVTLSPTLGLDFVGETKTNIVYGLTVGYGF